jgi:hypothetical protein
MCRSETGAYAIVRIVGWQSSRGDRGACRKLLFLGRSVGLSDVPERSFQFPMGSDRREMRSDPSPGDQVTTNHLNRMRRIPTTRHCHDEPGVPEISLG